MTSADFATLVGPALASALEKKGFTALMPVQQAVLDPELAGRDLRISSQTGSGKTVAIGLALLEFAKGAAPAPQGVARPRAMVVVPTRELAKQVNEELAWLFAPLHARVASATGGANVRDERRAFAAGPSVVVGTPGRLLDHLNRGGIDPSQLGAVVLDEADRMLDLGFRDELEAILKHAPEGHRTHLVSATFPHDVRALADRVQNDPARIEGTPLGTANADIDHVVHLVAQNERIGAMINLLLVTPGATTLVFARTRADVAQIARELTDAGFKVGALSGEMEQHERNLALAAFKRGGLHALVATDVAARGIDVQDIARVIHAEPPTDSDSYTHRSGRTGRAGRKGTSSILVTPGGLARTTQLLRRTGVKFRLEPIPTADDIRRASDEKLFAALMDEDEAAAPIDPRVLAIAERLSSAGSTARTIARLLSRTRLAGPEPREVHPLEAPVDRATRVHRGYEDAPGAPRARNEGGWVAFRFTWGKEHGADPRRLMAMACRRGGIRSGDIGAIQVGRNYSVVEVAGNVAASFERAAREHDPRDPRVTIRPEAAPAAPAAPAHEPRRADRGATQRVPHREPHRDRSPDRPRAEAQRVPAPPPSRPKRDPRAPPSSPKLGGGHVPRAPASRGGDARPKRKPPR